MNIIIRRRHTVFDYQISGGRGEKVLRRGLFVGRFQPFHLGHLHVAKKILEEVDELIIVVGSSQYSHTIDNPFKAGERITMIRKAMEEARIAQSRYWVIPVPDLHMHMMWVAEVVGYTPKFEIVFSNHALTRRLFKEAGFEVKTIEFYKRKTCSSTEIRRRMLEGKVWEELVPAAVADYVKSISGVSRLQDIVKTDTA